MKKQNKNNTKISWQIKDKREIEEPTVIQELRKRYGSYMWGPIISMGDFFCNELVENNKKKTAQIVNEKNAEKKPNSLESFFPNLFCML